MVDARMVAEPGVEPVEEGLRRQVVAGHQHGDQHAVAQTFGDGDDPIPSAATPIAAVPDIVAAGRAARAEEAALPLAVELRRRLVERGLADMRGLDAAGSVDLMLGERPRGSRFSRTTGHS